MTGLRRSLRIFSLFIFVLLPLAAAGQEKEAKIHRPKKQGMLFWKINRFDRLDRYHGRWKVYLGDEKTVIRNGRFRHGAEVGKWKYYYPSGTRYMVEKYNRRNNIIEVQKFHENGNLARQGTARIIRSTLKTITTGSATGKYMMRREITPIPRPTKAATWSAARKGSS